MMMMMMMMMMSLVTSSSLYVLFDLYLTEWRLIKLGLLSGIDRSLSANYYFTSSVGFTPGSLSDDHMSFYHKGMGLYEKFQAALFKGISLFRSLYYIRENSVTFEPLLFFSN